MSNPARAPNPCSCTQIFLRSRNWKPSSSTKEKLIMKTKWLCALALSVASSVASAEAKDEFVAHEWGTFTSVQGADGVQIQWTPSIKTDLPEFVYSRDGANGGFRNAALTDAFGK